MYTLFTRYALVNEMHTEWDEITLRVNKIIILLLNVAS